MSPSSNCYLDHYQADPATEPPAHAGNLVTLSTVYGYDPLPTSLTSSEAVHILGPQGNLWTEYVPTEAQAEYMTFPREIALAEIGWSPRLAIDYAGFVNRLRANVAHLDVLGVNYAKRF
jgi:hexosaminidase